MKRTLRLECPFYIVIKSKYSYLLYRHESFMIILSIITDWHSDALIYKVCIIACL